MKQSTGLNLLGATAAALALSLSTSGMAQQNQEVSANPKIIVVGHNPVITLREKEGGETLTSANFWRVEWSPAGSGTICYITVNEADQAPLRIAIYDNEKLLDYVTSELMSVLVPGFNEPAFTPVKGTVTQSGDVLSSRTETCKSDEYTVELTWKGLQPPNWVDVKPGGGILMTFAMLTATGAEVKINGKAAPGGFYTGPGLPPGFLALDEVWRR